LAWQAATHEVLFEIRPLCLCVRAASHDVSAAATYMHSEVNLSIIGLVVKTEGN